MAKERYVLQRRLGTGGMGEVWLATDSLLNRPVAVKFLQATADKRYKELFLSEARTLASLHHPNITLIYDAVFEEEENRFYIMMEYVEGKSLSTLIREAGGPLPLDITLEITTGVLRALQYAHSKGIVHRDVKPDNIVIQGGTVKLTDFGLASLISLLAKQDSRYIIGTPAYMPPEQIISEGVDGRTDLYALGVTLFEMVSGGRRPFSYTNRQQLLSAQIEENPPSVREYAPQTPFILERVITRLLEKHPDDRYPSAEVLLDLFNSIQARRKFGQRYLQLLDPDAKPMVGRVEELKSMEALWTETQASNQSHLLVIRGEMGIGKSRLIAHFLANSVVDKGLVAAIGRSDELKAPYTPFAEILASFFERGLVKPLAVSHQIDSILDQIPSLAPLLNIQHLPAPEKPRVSSSGLWKTLSSRLTEVVHDDSLRIRQQFFTTILTLLAELGPTVIFLDNANFLDDSSLSLIRFLIGQGGLPLLIVAECRAEGKPIPWLETFAEDEVEIIDLSPLSSSLIKVYLNQFLEGNIPEVLNPLIEKRSRGNPFHIEEIVRQLMDLGDLYRDKNGEWRYRPPSELDSRDLSKELVSPFLMSALIRRLEKLPEKDRALLALAALLEPGPEFDFELWVTVLGGEARRSEAQVTLQESLQRRLLREAGSGRYTFRPADVAGALAATVPPERQRELHRQMAEILASKGSDPILISYHFEQGGLIQMAVSYLEAAGARAMAVSAFDQAISCYNRVVKLTDNLSAFEMLGSLYRQRGDWPNSITTLQRAVELAEKTGNINDLARVSNSLSFTYWLADKYQESGQLASKVLKLEAVSNLERATAYSHLGMVSWLLGYLREAEGWCKKAVDLLSTGSDEARLAAVYSRLGLVYLARAKFAESLRVTNRALEIRRRLQDYWGEAYCLASLGQIATDQGKFDEAMAYLVSAQQLFEKIKSNDGLMVAYTEQSRTLLRRGQVEDALGLLGKSLRLAEEIGKRNAYGLADIYILVAQASLIQKQLERANLAIKDGLQLVEAAGNQRYVAAGWATLAQIYRAEGKGTQAEETFKKAITLFEQVDYPSGLLRTRLEYARLLAERGEAGEAAKLEQNVRHEAAQLGLHLG